MLTSLGDFVACDPRLGEYLETTARRQFVQRLGKKGKRRGGNSNPSEDSGDYADILAEVRAILRGDSATASGEPIEDPDTPGSEMMSPPPEQAGVPEASPALAMASVGGSYASPEPPHPCTAT